MGQRVFGDPVLIKTKCNSMAYARNATKLSPAGLEGQS